MAWRKMGIDAPLKLFCGALFAVTVLGGAESPLRAQQINIGANHHNVGFSYYESIGTNFGFYFPGHLNSRGHGIVGLMPNGQFTPDGSIWFTQGGGGVIPPFGGYDPNSGLQTGWSVRGPNGGFNFGLHASQGSSTFLGGDSLSLTLPNGGSGFITSGSFRPFVTGIIPVVGGGRAYLPPLTAKGNLVQTGPVEERTGGAQSLKSGSSAEAGSGSLAALRAEADAEDAALEETRIAEMERFVERAKAAMDEGKESLAGGYLKQAFKRATAPEREKIEAGWRNR